MKKSQLEKFRETAQQLETDDSEEAFDRAIARVAKTAPSSGEAETKKPGKRRASRNPGTRSTD